MKSKEAAKFKVGDKAFSFNRKNRAMEPCIVESINSAIDNYGTIIFENGDKSNLHTFYTTEELFSGIKKLEEEIGLSVKDLIPGLGKIVGATNCNGVLRIFIESNGKTTVFFDYSLIYKELKEDHQKVMEKSKIDNDRHIEEGLANHGNGLKVGQHFIHGTSKNPATIVGYRHPFPVVTSVGCAPTYISDGLEKDLHSSMIGATDYFTTIHDISKCLITDEEFEKLNSQYPKPKTVKLLCLGGIPYLHSEINGYVKHYLHENDFSWISGSLDAEGKFKTSDGRSFTPRPEAVFTIDAPFPPAVQNQIDRIHLKNKYGSFTPGETVATYDGLNYTSGQFISLENGFFKLLINGKEQTVTDSIVLWKPRIENGEASLKRLGFKLGEKVLVDGLPQTIVIAYNASVVSNPDSTMVYLRREDGAVHVEAMDVIKKMTKEPHPLLGETIFYQRKSHRIEKGQVQKVTLDEREMVTYFTLMTNGISQEVRENSTFCLADKTTDLHGFMVGQRLDFATKKNIEIAFLGKYSVIYKHEGEYIADTYELFKSKVLAPVFTVGQKALAFSWSSGKFEEVEIVSIEEQNNHGCSGQYKNTNGVIRQGSMTDYANIQLGEQQILQDCGLKYGDSFDAKDSLILGSGEFSIISSFAREGGKIDVFVKEKTSELVYSIGDADDIYKELKAKHPLKLAADQKDAIILQHLEKAGMHLGARCILAAQGKKYAATLVGHDGYSPVIVIDHKDYVTSIDANHQYTHSSLLKESATNGYWTCYISDLTFISEDKFQTLKANKMKKIKLLTINGATLYTGMQYARDVQNQTDAAAFGWIFGSIDKTGVFIEDEGRVHTAIPEPGMQFVLDSEFPNAVRDKIKDLKEEQYGSWQPDEVIYTFDGAKYRVGRFISRRGNAFSISIDGKKENIYAANVLWKPKLANGLDILKTKGFSPGDTLLGGDYNGYTIVHGYDNDFDQVYLRHTDGTVIVRGINAIRNSVPAEHKVNEEIFFSKNNIIGKGKIINIIFKDGIPIYSVYQSGGTTTNFGSENIFDPPQETTDFHGFVIGKKVRLSNFNNLEGEISYLGKDLVIIKYNGIYRSYSYEDLVGLQSKGENDPLLNAAVEKLKAETEQIKANTERVRLDGEIAKKLNNFTSEKEISEAPKKIGSFWDSRPPHTREEIAETIRVNLQKFIGEPLDQKLSDDLMDNERNELEKALSKVIQNIKDRDEKVAPWGQPTFLSREEADKLAKQLDEMWGIPAREVPPHYGETKVVSKKASNAPIIKPDSIPMDVKNPNRKVFKRGDKVKTLNSDSRNFIIRDNFTFPNIEIGQEMILPLSALYHDSDSLQDLKDLHAAENLTPMVSAVLTVPQKGEQKKLLPQAKKAAIRVAASQLRKLVKESLLKTLIPKHGSAIRTFFETEYGEVFIGGIVGVALSQIPNSPKVQIMAQEFQISSMAMAGNALADDVLAELVPVIHAMLGDEDRAGEARIGTSLAMEVSDVEPGESTLEPSKELAFGGVVR